MGQQLALPLEPRADSESALQHAWAGTRLRVPYQVAIHVPALAICLRNIAAAETRRQVRRAARARLQEKKMPWAWKEAEPAESLFSS